MKYKYSVKYYNQIKKRKTEVSWLKSTLKKGMDKYWFQGRHELCFKVINTARLCVYSARLTAFQNKRLLKLSPVQRGLAFEWETSKYTTCCQTKNSLLTLKNANYKVQVLLKYREGLRFCKRWPCSTYI